MCRVQRLPKEGSNKADAIVIHLIWFPVQSRGASTRLKDDASKPNP